MSDNVLVPRQVILYIRFGIDDKNKQPDSNAVGRVLMTGDCSVLPPRSPHRVNQPMSPSAMLSQQTYSLFQHFKKIYLQILMVPTLLDTSSARPFHRRRTRMKTGWRGRSLLSRMREGRCSVFALLVKQLSQQSKSFFGKKFCSSIHRFRSNFSHKAYRSN